MRADEVNTDIQKVGRQLLGSVLWAIFGKKIMSIVNKLLDRWGLRTPDGGTVF